MSSANIWLGASLIFGILIIWIGTVLMLVCIPLARGDVRASEYSYRPVQLYRLTDEEKDRLGKPTAIASMAVAALFILSGLASIALGVTVNVGPAIMYMFLGTAVLAVLALLGILLASLYFVGRAREKSAAK